MLIVLYFILFSAVAFGQSILGVWENVDDEDGKVKSRIEVYEDGGFIYGKVIELLPSATLTICKKCKGDRKNQPIEGMIIMGDLQLVSQEEAEKGYIIDPKKGKDYSCKIKLLSGDLLEVRGYIGNPIFGRSQNWMRAKI